MGLKLSFSIIFYLVFGMKVLLSGVMSSGWRQLTPDLSPSHKKNEQLPTGRHHCTNLRTLGCSRTTPPCPFPGNTETERAAQQAWGHWLHSHIVPFHAGVAPAELPWACGFSREMKRAQGRHPDPPRLQDASWGARGSPASQMLLEESVGLAHWN